MAGALVVLLNNALQFLVTVAGLAGSHAAGQPGSSGRKPATCMAKLAGLTSTGAVPGRRRYQLAGAEATSGSDAPAGEMSTGLEPSAVRMGIDGAWARNSSTAPFCKHLGYLPPAWCSLAASSIGCRCASSARWEQPAAWVWGAGWGREPANSGAPTGSGRGPCW